MVVSGRATAAMDDGRLFEMGPGEIFYIAPGHDSWVVGDEPYVSLHFLGADDYASHGQAPKQGNADAVQHDAGSG